jgi:hypothetical protein
LPDLLELELLELELLELELLEPLFFPLLLEELELDMDISGSSQM